MTETARKVTVANRIDNEHLIPFLLVIVLLQVDIVEVWKVAQLLLPHYPFGMVLPFVPSPGLVHFAEVLDNKLALLYTVFV